MKRRLPALAALCALTVTGCTQAAPTRDGTPAPAGSTTGASTPSASASSAPSLPSGYAWHPVEDAGLRFAGPAEWVAIDPEELAAAGDDAMMKDLADRMGVSVSQFRAVMTNADLILTAPPKDGFADSINAIVVPLTDLPTEAQLTAQLGSLVDGDVTYTATETPAGRAVMARYAIAAGNLAVQGSSIFVKGPEGVLNVTVTTRDAARTEQVSAVVLDSLSET
ncbi:hypothetical protein BCF74_1115 [Knoellia remsis]|uniref:Lipoprotein n=1 Tax=Knoellia remsis TaxID=407159 RepID=A0A2T0ULF8_9MICO|nr:hypothetical protein [Knoellia remsis]PRY58724.1 hypothetical protein BCF74_1115 [Knoellia remsis]